MADKLTKAQWRVIELLWRNVPQEKAGRSIGFIVPPNDEWEYIYPATLRKLYDGVVEDSREEDGKRKLRLTETGRQLARKRTRKDGDD